MKKRVQKQLQGQRLSKLRGGHIHRRGRNIGLYWGYIGIMEKRMDTTIVL